MNRNERRNIQENGTELDSVTPAFTQVQRNEIANSSKKKTTSRSSSETSSEGWLGLKGSNRMDTHPPMRIQLLTHVGLSDGQQV